MNKIHFGVLGLCALLVLGLAGNAMANGAVDGDEPAMMVSPSVIVLSKVDTVTVHTNIFYSCVNTTDLNLDGAVPISIGADSRGHLVAKFAVSDLELSPGRATLTLYVSLLDGPVLSLADTVGVR